MKYIAISGSWRYAVQEVFTDVESIVKKELQNGNVIVTGGAPGVDFIATQTVLDHGIPEKQLKIFLPTSLKILLEHYQKRISENILDASIGEKLISQLQDIQQNFPKCIYDDTHYMFCNTESYYARNTTIIEHCDILYAFCVNNSQGTMDAYKKAKKLGKAVHLKEYNSGE